MGASSATAINTAAPTTSYDRTLGNAQFEAARKQYGLSQEMRYGAILHAWMWSANTIKNNMQAIAASSSQSCDERCPPYCGHSETVGSSAVFLSSLEIRNIVIRAQFS